ncbi:MAG: tRNA pseudouridine(38-40) synthase TruA [Firmicutes bacterium]|nr:tRNA pseudouridine(38-40) synthase TruA [Bacillota bacterium]
MKRYLATVAYDGTNFFGWQKQNGFRTVQEELEVSLSALFHVKTFCYGASRTDRGVHALCQKAVFDAETTIPAEKIPLAIIKYLPDDISVLDCKEVDSEFNPRFEVKQKTYRYTIYNSEFMNPVRRNYTEFVRDKLDIEKMQEAAKAFLGEHDFKGFCSAHTSAKTTVRTIYDISVSQDNENEISIYVTGNGFLYNMVRIIAGTLIFAGIGKIDPEKMPEIIESGDRTRAGKTAGPEGLCLVDAQL